MQLDAQGYFSNVGARVIPVGVNYWPASCGVEMWPAWPVAEIQHDLDVVQQLGMNCVRFFLRWQDFEPEPERYDPRMFLRLAELLGWFRERGLYAHPSFFVGWMSGGIFWPAWKGPRNLYTDPFMARRAAAFARHAAAVCAGYDDAIIGLDFGNEMSCLPDSGQATTGEILAWAAEISRAIRLVYPSSLLVSGNEHHQVVGEPGWPLGEVPGVDFHSMHAYPVPGWLPMPVDGLTDPWCQSLLPFFTQVARTFGPVMVQEFGTIFTAGPVQQDAYLRALLPACWQAGANGFLWWCLRDVVSSVHPYQKSSFEGTLGLVDAKDQVKPGLNYFIEFASTLAERPLPTGSAEAIGLYFPTHFYARDNPQNPGNGGQMTGRRLAIAHYQLQALGRIVRVVRGGQPIDPALQTLVIPGVCLTSCEVETLTVWVEQGGQLIWHGPAWSSWGHVQRKLIGAAPVDFRAIRPVTLVLDSFTWGFTHYPEHTRIQVQPDAAEVIIHDGDFPILLRHTLGRGCVVTMLPLVEEEILAIAADRSTRDRWTGWYRSMLELVGRPHSMAALR